MKNKIIKYILLIVMILPVNIMALKKEESVFVNLDSSGNVSKTTVTNHLKVTDKNEILDETTLKDILNLNGKEAFTLNDNNINWQNLGKDIYYRGITNKQLPIEVSVKYYLNDEEINVKDLINKSGNIKIVMNFTNTLESKVKVNSKVEKLYTPFLTTVGTILSNDINTDIEISNGKILDSGNKTTLVGMATPGLYESLGFKELKKLNEINISYKTSKFKLPIFYMVSTPKLIETQDLKLFDKFDTVTKSMNTLKTNMDKIVDASSQLKNGSNDLSKSTTTIKTSIKTISDNFNLLNTGCGTLDSGVGEAIQKLKKANEELTSSDNSTSLKSLYTLKENNNLAIEKLIKKSMLSSVENIEKALSYLNEKTLTYKNLKDILDLIRLLQANNMAIDATIESLNNITTKINELLTQLDSGLGELSNGTKKLCNGIKTLNNGIDKLYLGSIKLEDGTKKLSNGMNTLDSGLNKFNKEGIKKISSYSNLVNNYKNKVEALVDLSENYNGYASNNSNNTIFVYLIKNV